MLSASAVVSIAAVLLVGVLVNPSEGKTCTPQEYGAAADGVTDDTRAIQSAIDACAGGGTVLLAGANFTSGAVFLRSNLDFKVEAGSTLFGTKDKTNASYPQIYMRVGGTMQFGHAALINGAICEEMDMVAQSAARPGDNCLKWGKLHNVTLSGFGTINGNGDSGWWSKPYFNDRPCLVGLYWIENLVIRDLLFTNSPFWTTHPTFCKNVEIFNLRVVTTGPNTDGIDPDSCQNVDIHDCFISTGDDCIAIKSGKDEDGRAVGIPTNNVTIRNMIFGQGHGISIGSEMSGNVTNILFYNLTLDGTQRGVRIKSQAGRGGQVANITYSNMTLSNVEEAISVSMFYSSGEGIAPIFKNFTIINIRGSNMAQAGDFECLDNSPCEGITLQDVQLHDYKKGFECKNAYGTSHDVSPDACLNQ